jgi:hypothetical protein
MVQIARARRIVQHTWDLWMCGLFCLVVTSVSSNVWQICACSIMTLDCRSCRKKKQAVLSKLFGCYVLHEQSEQSALVLWSSNSYQYYSRQKKKTAINTTCSLWQLFRCRYLYYILRVLQMTLALISIKKAWVTWHILPVIMLQLWLPLVCQERWLLLPRMQDAKTSTLFSLRKST